MVVEETAGRKPTFIVGKDTRVSSDMLEAALAAGLCSVGADVVLLGVVPTPAVAYLVTRYGADAVFTLQNDALRCLRTDTGRCAQAF